MGAGQQRPKECKPYWRKYRNLTVFRSKTFARRFNICSPFGEYEMESNVPMQRDIQGIRAVKEARAMKVK